MTKFTCMQIVLIGGMLATGSINTLSKKAQNDFVVQGFKSPPHSFKHPWVQTWMISIAMSLSLFGLPFQRRRELAEYRKQRIFLRRELEPTHWLGMIIVMVGLLLTGCSSVFKSQYHMTNGISLILAGQMVSSGQMILEEILLKRKNLHPLHVVGLKGMFAFVLMSFIVLPVLYFIPGNGVNDSFENSVDALYQIYNNSKLLVVCLLYIGSVALYNYFALSVIKSLTAVHSTLIDACRVILVWGVGFIIYYAFDKNFGEPFDKSYGILQADGFLFLVIGTAMYNQLIDLRNCVPCCAFTSNKVKNENNSTSYQDNLQDDTSRPGDEINNERRHLLEEQKS